MKRNEILSMLLLCCLTSAAVAQNEVTQAVTIEKQGTSQDQADDLPTSCQDLIEEVHRLRLSNEYLHNELNASIQQIDKMKTQMEKLLQLQTQLYEKLEQQLQQTEPGA